MIHTVAMSYEGVFLTCADVTQFCRLWASVRETCWVLHVKDVHSLILREQQHSQFLHVKLQLCSHPALVGAFASLLSIISTYSIRIKWFYHCWCSKKKKKVRIGIASFTTSYLALFFQRTESWACHRLCGRRFNRKFPRPTAVQYGGGSLGTTSKFCQALLGAADIFTYVLSTPKKIFFERVLSTERICATNEILRL